MRGGSKVLRYVGKVQKLPPRWIVIFFVLIIVVAVASTAIIYFRLYDAPHSRTSYESFNDTHYEKCLYVETLWGLGNRLRTMNAAYEVAKMLNRKLIIVIENTFDKNIMDAHPHDLIASPHLTVIRKRDMKGLKYKTLKYNVPDDCSIKTRIKDLRKHDSDKNLHLFCCGLFLVDIKLKHLFYKELVPTQKVMDHIAHVLHKIKNNYVVGVHIRQGTIGDYYNGNFFGRWDNSDDRPPTLCCVEKDNDDETGKDDKNTCPNAAPHLKLFVEKMREVNADMFFVCSDRPGCMLVLEQEFPKKIIYNPLSVNYDVNTFAAFCDWYCLGQCNKLILSSLSSFSSEAKKLGGAEHMLV